MGEEEETYIVLLEPEIRLSKLHCSLAGEVGEAEPYLWAAFFKFDGMQNRITISYEGPNYIARFERGEGWEDHVTVRPLPAWASQRLGGHGNIGSGWETGKTKLLARTKFSCQFDSSLWPINVYFVDFPHPGDEILVRTLPGFIGCVAVLMEEDRTPDHAVLAGFTAFLRAIADGLNEQIAGLEIEMERIIPPPEIDLEELVNEVEANLRDFVEQRVEAATLASISSPLEMIAMVADPDDKLGVGSWILDTSELQEGPPIIQFESEVWHPVSDIGISHGHWQLFGEVGYKDPRTGTTICFIATATYGTSLHPELWILRNWRDRTLKKTRIGQELTKLYYQLSPPFADIISRSERMRKFVRIVLDPIIDFIYRRHPELV
ncbi:MAG: CFI-box-CTERM domain-containing protein [Candidatus Thorarchaeota archaeon]|jgi:hypothetical protein